MSYLHVKTYAAETAAPITELAGATSRIGRAVRSLSFILFFFLLYLPFAVGLGQRLVLWPLVAIRPSSRQRLARWWLRLHARTLLRITRAVANVRVYARGRIPAEPAIILMNHQSVLDIPIALELAVGPQVLIPTRIRYFRGIPGISHLLRIARFPPVTQRRDDSGSDLSGIAEAADKVARGENSFFIFPEGHRTHDGDIQRFMTRGLKLTLARAKRPVYCIVADGMWHARTFADATLRFAGTTARVTIIGPFDPPEEAEIASFIDTIRSRMSDALAELRTLSDADVVASFRLLPD